MTSDPIAADTPVDPASGARGRDLAGVLAGGVFMGAAEIVPGVSGGTIALVFGLYDRMITALSTGANSIGLAVRGDGRGALDRVRRVDWPFVAALVVGMGAAIVGLSQALDHLLETQPVAMSALFAGLIAGSVVLARRELHAPMGAGATVAMVAVAVVVFVALGATPGRVPDPSLPLFFAAAAIAICAMVLPGISGSFILLLLGMYEPVLGAVNDRDLAIVAVFAAGAVTGLALFSSLLHAVLRRHHDVTLAMLIGLMAGSVRVLWPWPVGGPDIGIGEARLGVPPVDDLPVAIAAAVVGVVVVVTIARIGAATVGDAAEEPADATTIP